MKVYVLSLGAGLPVGMNYSLLNVHSPAPLMIALVRLFGILAGEQLIPVGKKLLAGSSISASWRELNSHVWHVAGAAR
jgi:XapX domain-containing protein